MLQVRPNLLMLLTLFFNHIPKQFKYVLIIYFDKENNPMIFAKPTKFNAGLTIYGDYVDFTSLHSTIYELADEKNNDLGQISEYLLVLAYEIRHAYQGDRLTLQMEGNSAKEPNDSAYLGFNILWTEFLPQLVMLRDAASYQILNRSIQADLWRLEACAEEALLKADAKIGLECMNWLKNAPRFSTDYYLEFISDSSYSYVHRYSGKRRIKYLPDILRQMSCYSRAYKEFVAGLETFAAEKAVIQNRS